MTLFGPLIHATTVFQLTHDDEIITLQLDMEQRKNFYLIFKEAVNNAIKYSGATALQAHVSVTKNQLILQVKDNGVGFNPEIEMANQSTSLSGNGLRNMHNRAAQLQGTITITTAPSKGTVITLQMPI
jgi:signal transduction histidine kinase